MQSVDCVCFALFNIKWDISPRTHSDGSEFVDKRLHTIFDLYGRAPPQQLKSSMRIPHKPAHIVVMGGVLDDWRTRVCTFDRKTREFAEGCRTTRREMDSGEIHCATREVINNAHQALNDVGNVGKIKCVIAAINVEREALQSGPRKSW